jgi:hypothetical protein
MKEQVEDTTNVEIILARPTNTSIVLDGELTVEGGGHSGLNYKKIKYNY